MRSPLNFFNTFGKALSTFKMYTNKISPLNENRNLNCLNRVFGVKNSENQENYRKKIKFSENIEVKNKNKKWEVEDFSRVSEFDLNGTVN